MTTHVFIVNRQTFRLHLEYMFAGTGAKDKDADFNNTSSTSLHHSTENGLVAMLADCCRIRQNDYVVFYVQADSGEEGKFYGIFQAESVAFIDHNDNSQFLKLELGKSLTFRIKILPFIVYSEGVSEWEALDEIKSINSPCQMLWSLIYRKLKGNRGNTMITIYEAERLFSLIQRKNDNKSLSGNDYTFNGNKICTSLSHSPYSGREERIDILSRLCFKHETGTAFETHLQMYIIQTIGCNSSLDSALGINNSCIEWIGNEVSCGVGMQRIDIMISFNNNEIQRTVMPIELKAVQASEDNVRQINRYIDWIEQYYVPNRPSIIQPVLICRSFHGGLTSIIKQKLHNFNSSANGRYLPLIYIEYTITSNPDNVSFSKVAY